MAKSARCRCCREVEKDETPAGLHRAVWMLAWPSVLTMLLQTFNSFLDRFFVGHLGSDALAAVGVGGQFMVPPDVSRHVYFCRDFGAGVPFHRGAGAGPGKASSEPIPVGRGDCGGGLRGTSLAAAFCRDRLDGG